MRRHLTKVTALQLVALSLVCFAAIAVSGQIVPQMQPERLGLSGLPLKDTVPASLGRDSTRDTDALIAGRRAVRLTDVQIPTLRFYPARRQGTKATAAMLVLPGGGYQVLADDLEGTEVCAWLNGLGISAVLLDYRVPSSAFHAEPLQDAEQASATMHRHADEWGLDTRRMGVIGFSAGADLAARLTHAESDAFALQMLIYPAYLASVEGLLRPDVVPARNASATFLVQANDDPVGIENSAAYLTAMVRQKASVEIHVYQHGGHGYGLRRTADPVTKWTDPAEIWLAERGFAVNAGP